MHPIPKLANRDDNDGSDHPLRDRHRVLIAAAAAELRGPHGADGKAADGGADGGGGRRGRRQRCERGGGDTGGGALDASGLLVVAVSAVDGAREVQLVHDSVALVADAGGRLRGYGGLHVWEIAPIWPRDAGPRNCAASVCGGGQHSDRSGAGGGGRDIRRVWHRPAALRRPRVPNLHPSARQRAEARAAAVREGKADDIC